MKVLLHICCAPCSCMCIRSLRDEQMDVTGFWYNPNIHPFTEYRARRNCLREYAGEIRLPLLEEDRYCPAAVYPHRSGGYREPVREML